MYVQRIKRPAVFVTAAYDNVAGVRLPVFQITTDPTVDSEQSLSHHLNSSSRILSAPDQASSQLVLVYAALTFSSGFAAEFGQVELSLSTSSGRVACSFKEHQPFGWWACHSRGERQVPGSFGRAGEIGLLTGK